MSTVESKILAGEERRLASLKRAAHDSRSLFDTFLMHSDHLLRFTDDLLRRAEEIEFPSAPTISVTKDARATDDIAGRARVIPATDSAPPREISLAPSPTTQPSAARVLDLTDPPKVAPSPPAPSALTGRSAPIVVVIGPVDRMGEIEDLTIDLETVPEIDVHFRLFRAGAYRIDASCSDVAGFTERLRTRKDVLSVDQQGSMVHVLPAPITL